MKKTHFVELKICPIMLRNIIGQIFNSTLDRFSAQPFSHVWPFFPFSKYAQTTIFIGFSAKYTIFVAHPQKLGTLFVNTTALTVFFLFVLFFCIFGFWGFCCVRFYGGLFLRGMKKRQNSKKWQNSKQNNKKGKKTTRCKQQNHLVLFLREKPDNTVTKQYKSNV